MQYIQHTAIFIILNIIREILTRLYKKDIVHQTVKIDVNLFFLFFPELHLSQPIHSKLLPQIYFNNSFQQQQIWSSSDKLKLPTYKHN